MADSTPDILDAQPAADTPIPIVAVHPQPAEQVSQPSGPGTSEPVRRKPTLDQLPDYARSLLRVKVPVVVNLAEKRQPLGQIVELVPGSIIQFEKSCEDMLELSVADCRVATGEAVKVNDKFGLRITSVTLPEERFSTVRPQ